MPKRKHIHERSFGEKTLVIDNGAYTIKAGFATSNESAEKDCQIVPNCFARSKDKHVWIAAQLDQCNDFAEMVFRRPVEKGFLVNWDAQKAIWDETFLRKNARLKCDPRETNLILTEAPNCPLALQTNCDQMVFEYYGFQAYYRCIGPCLNAYNDFRPAFGDPIGPLQSGQVPTECMIIIDSGYSHTTVTPIFRGRPLQSAIRRLEIGGKFMTNYLKELVSIRQYNMLDETYLMNEVKEAVSYVSADFKGDLEKTWKGNEKKTKEAGDDTIFVDYVLPDYTSRKHGVVRPHDPLAKLKRLGGATGMMDSSEDFMTLGNERFVIPELLFNPNDVGLNQLGIQDIVLQSLSKLPPAMWPAMFANILVVGGNANIKGFVERLQAEIRQLAPTECTVRVIKPSDAIRSTWLGGVNLANDPTAFDKVMVTREEYEEYGTNWLTRKFRGELE